MRTSGNGSTLTNPAPADIQTAGQADQPPARKSELSGVWRRQFLQLGDDYDDTSVVYWVQGRNLFCDIRVPSEEAGASQPLEAFAGVLSGNQDRFTWDREIEWSLTPSPPDEGFLRWDGDVLREDGVHIPYIEYWERVALPRRNDFAVRLAEKASRRQGFAIQLGTWTFYAFGRLPGGQTQTDSGYALAKDDGNGPLILYATSHDIIGAPLQIAYLADADELQVICGTGSPPFGEMRWQVVERETLGRDCP